jgi:hypothetical protein
MIKSLFVRNWIQLFILYPEKRYGAPAKVKMLISQAGQHSSSICMRKIAIFKHAEILRLFADLREHCSID